MFLSILIFDDNKLGFSLNYLQVIDGKVPEYVYVSFESILLQMSCTIKKKKKTQFSIFDKIKKKNKDLFFIFKVF